MSFNLSTYLSGAILILILYLFSPGTSFSASLYPLDSAKKVAQFNHLLKDLRCLVCQNQDLVDSQAPLAKDLRGQVYLMVKEGQSDEDIIRYLTQRYGDFILFNPPLKAVTWFLWFGPFLLLLLGCTLFWRTCCKRVL